MALAPGTRLGPYEILEPLGAGGMGEVYRARDSRLNRVVAVKVLSDESAADPDRRDRFEREARAISALDHPHICPLYDVGQHEGIYYLVMPCLEGQTLADRLTKGPLPLDQALRFAIEIASALDAAHRHGIVHRDLKPGNVMLTKAGVKLLDFGLAKLKPSMGPLTYSGIKDLPNPVGDSTNAPLTGTAIGTLLGTMPYMAPEQLEGRDVDSRSDIFAFGAVVYEMVTGQRAFKGDTPASVIGAILKDQPAPMGSTQPLTPPALDHIVRTCLAKDPDERWQSAADIARELRRVGEANPKQAPPVATQQSRRRTAIQWAAAGFMTAAVIAIGTAIAMRPRDTAPQASLVRFDLTPPDGTTFAALGASIPSIQLALSPDGRRVVFVATPSAGRSVPVLWLRTLDNVTPQMLAGTENATYPFWSPDNRFIGFFANGRLRKIDTTGGLVQVLCDASNNARGGTWNTDGVIVFGPGTGTGLARVSAAGGPVTPVTTLQPDENSHRWPFFLPDGRHFLYFARGGSELRGIYVGSLDGTKPRRIVESEFNAAYVPGYLLIMREGALLAYPFDLTELRITGDPVSVAERVGGSSTQLAGFSAADGVLTYGHGLTTVSQLTWFDRSGKALGSPVRTGDFVNFRLSPDDTRLAVTRVDPEFNTADVWLTDLSRAVETRFTLDPMNDTAPVWSPDGQRIVFRSDRAGGNYLFGKASSGGARDELIRRMEVSFPTDWSGDGRHLLYQTPGVTTGYDVFVLPLSGDAPPSDAPPTAVAQTPFDESGGRFSRDGRWIAYESNESGTLEVYVQPFPATGSKWAVSSGGGGEPRWGRDGKELFYIASDRRLMSVPINTSPSFSTGVARPLFQTRVTSRNLFRTNYEVSADGRRFLVNTVLDGGASPAITVVLNWMPGIQAK